MKSKHEENISNQVLLDVRKETTQSELIGFVDNENINGKHSLTFLLRVPYLLQI